MGNWPVVGLRQSTICWLGEGGLLMDDDAHLANLLQCFNAVIDIQFFVDVLQMGLDGHRCDIKSCGNFLVAQSLSHQRKNFDFSLGENQTQGMFGQAWYLIAIRV